MVNVTTLRRALTDPWNPTLRPLPDEVADLLVALDAPPRLGAHLRIVHDVAAQLVDWMSVQHPALAVDREAVLFGAATHDIGKAVVVSELSGPGSEHECGGYELLVEHGFPEARARFARTHSAWATGDVELEDLLVSLADKAWKDHRVAELENLLLDRISAASGQPVWHEFLALDDELTRISDDSEALLAFQSSFPVMD